MKKKLLTMLLAVVMAFSLLPGTVFAASASGSCGANVRWSYSNGTLTIQGTGKMADYNPIFGVDPPWFAYRDQIHTVNIGDGVTAIGNYAFTDCENLTGVTIPGSVTTIGQGAFSSCTSLTSVTIPRSVTTIGAAAFDNCTSLTGINVASGNPAYSSVDGVLFNADQTLLITYPAGKSGASYSIPASVTSIGDSAFYNCGSLTSMTIPGNVKSVGSSAFGWCTNLTDVTIPNSVTTIGTMTFFRCDSLTSVTIPGSVTGIEEQAFRACSSLTSVTILNGVTFIDFQAFTNCGSLTDVTIPSSVTSIGEAAFSNCSSLKNVYYGGSASQWAQISIWNGLRGNNTLLNADIHYNSAMPTAPAEPEPPAAPAFTDVPAGIWYEDAVNWAVENGITNGTGNNHFSPGNTCTHAQILTMLYRAAQGEGAATVDDMTKAVSWAREKGMINDAFDGSKSCTRADAVTYIWQAFGKPSAAASSFSDVSPSDTYAKAVDWAVEKEITNGTNSEGTLFSPDGICTRGHIVTFLYRAYAAEAGLTV